ncbi:5-formyltetrahydrofolate cyclo-ligase [Algibacillus agarilyticus]|uniref:5-formyltetrahydrofolate cyclo-ligase n=1 Tax=Algibacillus agarilyticus TaxID=2234133 RepID=UPI000DCFDE9F|nr:5-formyltetrahydrofolate cyclo-ligase [Algibacillus agarilyticus]
MNVRQQIRSQIRHARQQLTLAEQNEAQVQVLIQFKKFIQQYPTIKKIGLYLANDGELSTQTIIDYCHQTNIEIYLPVIHPFCSGHLLFLHYDKSTLLIKNKYGIAEPKLTATAICPTTELDCVFTPLVAFDTAGQRLGMGGGYYDRTFAFTQQANSLKPILVGLAHQCQQVDHLPTEAWDVPLPAIITPEYIFCFQ